MIEAHALTLRQEWEASEAMLLRGGWEKLEGALARPRQHAEYQQADLERQAVVLAHGIVAAHGFSDGNKRTASAVLRLFLRANGYNVNAPKRRIGTWMIQLERGELDEVEAEVRMCVEPCP